MPASISLRKGWQIVGMSREGMKPGAIATQLHVSRKSVWSILSLHRRTQDITPRKSSGHPRQTTARQDCLLFGMVRRWRRRSTVSLWDEWRNDLERPVTVNRRLLERGYRARRPVKKPKRNARHKGLRLRFARPHRNLTVHHWQDFQDNFRYQDDKNPAHRSRVVRDFLEQEQIHTLYQPPLSPDCNPIEHLWVLCRGL